MRAGEGQGHWAGEEGEEDTFPLRVLVVGMSLLIRDMSVSMHVFVPRFYTDAFL